MENPVYGDLMSLEDDILRLNQELRLLNVEKKITTSQVGVGMYSTLMSDSRMHGENLDWC